MLRQSDGYLSGQQLCDHFQVSRTAVWKAINQLKEEGYEIEAVRNKGYRIVDIPDRITADAIKSCLETKWMAKNLEYYDEIDSTNNRAKALGEAGGADGTLFVAETQTAGKGSGKRMKKEIKRVKRERVYQGTIVDVYKDYMEFSNGNHEVWDYIHHKGAAAVIPVMDDGRLLMVRQYRNALDRFTLELPAGGLDQADEPGRDCSARELEEETGYHSDDLEWLITLRTTVALCNEKIEVYVARNLIRTHQHLDENEFVNVEAHTVEELKQMIFEGKIEDSKTVAAILAYDAKYNR